LQELLPEPGVDGAVPGWPELPRVTPGGSVGGGRCLRIMSGAVMPAGPDAVVPLAGAGPRSGLGSEGELHRRVALRQLGPRG